MVDEMLHHHPSRKDFWENVSSETLVRSLAGRLFKEAGKDRPEEFAEQVGELQTSGAVERIIDRVPEMGVEELLATSRDSLLKTFKAVGSGGNLAGDTVYNLFLIAEQIGKRAEHIK